MEILGDFSTSMHRALKEIDPNYLKLPGIVVCGTHDPKNVQEQLDKITHARTNYIPFLGVCFGHQLAFIEYCRNVLGIKDATSEEFGEEGTFVVVKREGLKVGLHEGETYWSNYDCIKIEEGWDKNWNFFTTAFHPEYQSSKGQPHPLLVEFLNACTKNIAVINGMKPV